MTWQATDSGYYWNSDTGEYAALAPDGNTLLSVNDASQSPIGQLNPTASDQSSAPGTQDGYTYLAGGEVRQATGGGGLFGINTNPYELLTADGWKNIGTPPHAESAFYVSTALDSPVIAEFLKFATEHPDQLNREQQLFMQNPLSSLDSYGQGYRWGVNDLYDNQLTPQFAGQVMQTAAYNQSFDANLLTPEEKQAGTQFNYEQSPEQQSARAGGDDGFLGAVLTIAAVVFAPYIVPEIAAGLGVSNTVAAGVFGAAKSLVTGGDIQDIVTGGLTGGVGAELLGGGQVAGNESDWWSGGSNYVNPATTTFAGNAGQTDVPTQNDIGTPDLSNAGGALDKLTPQSPGEFGTTLPDAGGATVSPGGTTPANPLENTSGWGYNETDPYTRGSMDASGMTTTPPESGGLISGAMDWAKQNKELAAALVGGAGMAVSGIGTGLLNKSIAEERIQADKDLVAQKFAQDTTGRAQFVQSNPSVFNWRRPFRPSGQPLRRLSTGQPVYQGGLIASRMRS